MQRIPEKSLLLFLCLVFSLISSINILKESPYDGYDTPRHLYYISSVKAGRGTPQAIEDGNQTYVSHHPPLFYYLASFIVEGDQSSDSLRRMQYLAVLTTIAFAIVGYLCIRQIESRPSVRLLGFFFLLFSPTLFVLGDMVSNEMLSNLFATSSILFFLLFLKKLRPIPFLVSCVFLALAINTKVNHLLIYPLYGLILLYLSFRERRVILLLFIIPLAISLSTLLPYIEINLERYGSIFPPVLAGTPDISLPNYFLIIDPKVVGSPFYPVGAFSSFWSTAYGTIMSDYYGYKHPSADHSASICTRKTGNLDRYITCTNYKAYTVLSVMGLVILAMFLFNFGCQFIKKRTELSVILLAALSLMYLVTNILLVNQYPFTGAGMVKSAYFLSALPFFYYLSASGLIYVIKTSLKYFVFAFITFWAFFSLQAFIL